MVNTGCMLMLSSQPISPWKKFLRKNHLAIFCNVSENHCHLKLKVPLHYLVSDFFKTPKCHQLISILRNHLWCCQDFLWRNKFIINIIFYLFENGIFPMHFSCLTSWEMWSSNGYAVMVRLVENLSTWNLDFLFLYFVHVFE